MHVWGNDAGSTSRGWDGEEEIACVRQEKQQRFFDGLPAAQMDPD
jgi:hypothetical protein